MSNLATDIFGIWTDTRSTVEAGRTEGRGRREWLIVIGTYVLLLVAVSIFSILVGADKLLDHFLGIDTNSDDWITASFITIGVVACLTLVSVMQWLVLPRVAGWFGGSRSRSDASIAFYFLLCAGILINLPIALLDVLAVGLQKLVPPFGSYFYASYIVGLLLVTGYLGGRVIEASQSVIGFGRAIGVWLASFLIAILVVALLALIVMFFIAVFYPDLLETSP